MTPAEEFFLKMLLERVKLGKKLTPMVLKARRAYFTLRNMLQVKYRSIHSYLSQSPNN